MRVRISSLLLLALSFANFAQSQGPNDGLEEGQQCAGDEDGSSFNAYACVWVDRDRNSNERIRVRYAILNPDNPRRVYARYTVYWDDNKNYDSARLIENDKRGARKKGWRRYDRDGIDVDKVRISACIERGNRNRDDDDECRSQEIFLRDFRERNF